VTECGHAIRQSHSGSVCGLGIAWASETPRTRHPFVVIVDREMVKISTAKSPTTRGGPRVVSGLACPVNQVARSSPESTSESDLRSNPIAVCSSNT